MKTQRPRLPIGNAMAVGQGRAPIAKLLAIRQFGNALGLSMGKVGSIGQGAGHEK